MSASETVIAGDGLARRSVSTFEVGAQSVANVAPSAVIAFAPAAMAASAGNGAWLSFAIALVGVMAIGYCVCVFARRRAGATSLYAFSRLSLGPGGAFVTGWALLIGAVCIAAGSLAGAGYYTSRVLETVGVQTFAGSAGQVFLDIVLVLIAAWLTIVGVRLAARVSSALEVLSIVLIVLVLIAVLITHGEVLDLDQITLKGFDADGIVFAVVLAVLGFVGFEGAASLGAEAAEPYRAIPRAVMGSAVLAGVLYIFATYAQVVGAGGPEALAASADPMEDLARGSGLDFLGPFLDIGFAASFLAVVMACITVAARLLFGMGKEGVLPAWLARTHPRHRTPTSGIATVTPVVAVATCAVVGAGTEPLLATTYIDTVGTFGYMLSYILICVGAPLFIRRLGAAKLAVTVLCGVVGTVVMAYVFYRNIFPVPAAPMNLLPYVFVAVLVLGIAGFAALRFRDPEAAQRAGTYAEDA
jgi:amino acid transporter